MNGRAGVGEVEDIVQREDESVGSRVSPEGTRRLLWWVWEGSGLEVGYEVRCAVNGLRGALYCYCRDAEESK